MPESATTPITAYTTLNVGAGIEHTERVPDARVRDGPETVRERHGAVSIQCAAIRS